MAVIISCAWPVVAWLIARAIVQQASFKVIERAPRVVMVDDHSEELRVRNRDFDGARQISIWRSHKSCAAAKLDPQIAGLLDRSWRPLPHTVLCGILFALGRAAAAALVINSVRRRIQGRVTWEGRVYS